MATTADITEIADGYADAWRRRDLDAIVAFHAPDIVFENLTGVERAEGDAVRDEIAKVFAIWPDIVFESGRRHVGENVVVEEWTARATHTQPIRRRGAVAEPTGKRVEWRGVDVLEWEDGLLKRKAFAMDTLSMLRQLGLVD